MIYNEYEGIRISCIAASVPQNRVDIAAMAEDPNEDPKFIKAFIKFFISAVYHSFRPCRSTSERRQQPENLIFPSARKQRCKEPDDCRPRNHVSSR